MPLESDYADFLRSFIEYHVKYLVVGAHAVGFHAEPRATLDFDVWIERTPTNARLSLRGRRVVWSTTGRHEASFNLRRRERP